MNRIFAAVIFAMAAFSAATAQRLPELATPENCKLTFRPDLEKATFEGDESIFIHVLKPTSEVTLNAVDIDFRQVTIDSAITLAALNGDRAFYDRLLATSKNAKSPEEYYMALSGLSQFSDTTLLHRTLNYAVSPDIRSQDALHLISEVMLNPAGEKLAWDFVLAHWESVQKVGGPFASAEIGNATSSFCDRNMRDQVVDSYAAHKIEAAERTYRQSIEQINNCVELKSQQGAATRLMARTERFFSRRKIDLTISTRR